MEVQPRSPPATKRDGVGIWAIYPASCAESSGTRVNFTPWPSWWRQKSLRKTIGRTQLFANSRSFDRSGIGGFKKHHPRS